MFRYFDKFMNHWYGPVSHFNEVVGFSISNIVSSSTPLFSSVASAPNTNTLHFKFMYCSLFACRTSNCSRICSASFMNSVLGSPESADCVNESPSFSKFVIFRCVLARSLLTSFNVLGIFDMTKIAERSGLGGRLASGMRRVAGNFHSQCQRQAFKRRM